MERIDLSRLANEIAKDPRVKNVRAKPPYRTFRGREHTGPRFKRAGAPPRAWRAALAAR